MDTLDRSAEPVEEKSVSPATLFRRAGGAASALVGLVREHQQAFLTVLSFLLIAAGWAAERWGSPAWAILLYAGGFVAGGYHSAREGLTTLIRERDLDVDLLMVVAAIGAASIGYWADGAVLILIFAFSGTLEEYAMRRTGRDIAALMTLSPETATVFKDGREVEVPVQEIRAGRPGPGAGQRAGAGGRRRGGRPLGGG